MDATVTQFYTKNPEEGTYLTRYEEQHGDRLDHVVKRFGLDALRGARVADIGGGLGFLGRRIDSSNDYWVFDGARHPVESRVTRGTWRETDLDHDSFGTVQTVAFDPIPPRPIFDYATILETIEHCGNPHHVLVQTKAMVKRDAPILISIPTESVTHNAPYPSLLWPTANWELFLRQMALPILDRWTYEPAPGKGWPAYHYLCRNADWSEDPRRMLFPKDHPKFSSATPLAQTNL